MKRWERAGIPEISRFLSRLDKEKRTSVTAILRMDKQVFFFALKGSEQSKKCLEALILLCFALLLCSLRLYDYYIPNLII